MRIRTTCTSDVAAIEALLRAVPGVWQSLWRDDAVSRALLASDGLAFVAEQEATLVGFVCAHDTGFRAYLSEVVVSESWQRRGIGAALMAAVQRAIAERGCQLVVADIYPPAAPFYRKLKWVEPSATLLCRRLGSASVA